MRFRTDSINRVYKQVTSGNIVLGYWNTLENLLNATQQNLNAHTPDVVHYYHDGGRTYGFIAKDKQDAYNAIKGETMTFGVEIEIAGSKQSIIDSLSEAGGFFFTKIEQDSSIYRNLDKRYCSCNNSGYDCDCFGAEIIFMPFTLAASKDVLTFIDKLVRCMKKNNLVANRTTGIHVHCIGVSNRGLEKIIDFMVDENKGASPMFIRGVAGRSTTEYCSVNRKTQIDKSGIGMEYLEPIGDDLYRLDKGYKLLKFAERNVRNSMINLISLNRPDKLNTPLGRCIGVGLGNGKNHFEFRAMNSSIQPERVVNRIKTVIWLCKNSERSNKEISLLDFFSSRPVSKLLENPALPY